MNGDPQRKAIETIEGQMKDLVAVVNQMQGDSDFDAARERMRRWKDRTVRLLAKAVNSDDSEALANKRKGSFIMGAPAQNVIDEAEMYLGFLQALLEEVREHPDEAVRPAGGLPKSVEESRSADPPVDPAGRVVFIVHGHDELNTLRLKTLLQDRWGIQSIVLSNQPGKGRTLIEKFEQEAQRAAFALVLLTPDDVVAVPDGQYLQARPNVIFELGWFYGRVGRSKTCILFKKGTRIHSDLDGINRIEFAESVEEKVIEIERELHEARLV
jgi:predicted nucleotide-binding protein